MPYTVAFAALVVMSCDAFVPLPLQLLSHPQTSSYGYHHRQSSRQHVVSVVTGDGSTSQQLRRIITDDVLPRMISFFSLDMVDSSTNRFYYLCRPPTGEHEHRHMPIRDLAAAWDATKALLFLEKNDAISDQGDYYWNDAAEIRQRLREAVHATLEAYHPLVPTEDGAGTGCDGPSSELTLDSNNTLKAVRGRGQITPPRAKLHPRGFRKYPRVHYTGSFLIVHCNMTTWLGFGPVQHVSGRARPRGKINPFTFHPSK